MASISQPEYINGFLLNRPNPWTYTTTDFEYSKLYKQMKKEQKEQKEKEARDKLNMIHTKPIPTGQHLPHVPVQHYFIGTDNYGFNHYSTLNSSGILIYYYIDKSGLYHYYN
jgi:hypothetical protein